MIEIQKWIYDQLKAKGYKVYDTVPARSKPPYIVIGEEIIKQGSSKERDLETVETINIWSDKKGYKELKTIEEDVLKLFNLATGETANYLIALTLVDNVIIQEEEKFKRAIIRIRMKIFKKEG